MLPNLDFHTIIALAAILLSTGLGLAALPGKNGSPVYRIFALGMLVLAAEQVFSALGMRADFTAELRKWEYFRMLAGALVPGVWLAFSVSFAREDPKASIAKWKWVLIALAVLPVSLVLFTPDLLFLKADLSLGHEWVLIFGWPAFIYHSLFLAGSILILVNLEKTLRASSGVTRWRIKFMLLGIGCLFAARIYTTSERLLFLGDKSALCAIDSATLLFANLLVLVSAVRTHLRNYSVYVSQDVLYNSALILIVGVYLIALGVVAKIARYFGAGELLLQNAFLFFIAFVGLAVLLLSSDIRYRTEKFVSTHFRRPLYDYKKVLGALAERTTTLVNMQDFCSAVAKIIAETVHVPAVSIWLKSETQNSPALCGSTHLPLSRELDHELENEIRFLMISLRDKQGPIELHPQSAGSETIPESEIALNKERIHCCIPLAAGGELLGIITLGGKLAKESFTLEDFDLLKIIANQAAGFILNHRLFESLSAAREMETSQRLSAFFVHDMKNLASTLSLTLENLPLHYNNPKYREGATRIIAGSLQKIQDMCSRLSSLVQKPDLDYRECDLNRIVLSVISNFDSSPDVKITQDLGQIPPVKADPGQIEKVVLNLILNAKEASGADCRVKIETTAENAYAVLSVLDNGCGMSREFIAGSLFKPFKSTKTKGLGIGLYQSKMIIEAHQGKIEVESQEGKGSRFRIFLPVAE
jgi:putative PEP-CTERM system histidine kinase